MTGEDRITVSWSEINMMRQCLLKWQLGYKERWTQDDVGGPRALGIAWHEVMAAHFRELFAIQRERLEADTGPRAGGYWQYDTAETLRVAEAATAQLTNGGYHDDVIDKLTWMYHNYCTVYDLTPNWTILAVEYNAVGWLPRTDGQKSNFDCKVFVDLVVLDQVVNQIWIVDHKSGSRDPGSKLNDLNDQFGLYTWILRQLGKNVFGSMMIWTSTYRHVDKETKKAAAERERLLAAGMPAWKANNGHTPRDYVKRHLFDKTDHELVMLAIDATKMLGLAYGWNPEESGDLPSSPDPEWCQRACDFSGAHIASRKGFADLRGYLFDQGFRQNFERQGAITEEEGD